MRRTGGTTNQEISENGSWACKALSRKETIDGREGKKTHLYLEKARAARRTEGRLLGGRGKW